MTESKCEKYSYSDVSFYCLQYLIIFLTASLKTVIFYYYVKKAWVDKFKYFKAPLPFFVSSILISLCNHWPFESKVKGRTEHIHLWLKVLWHFKEEVFKAQEGLLKTIMSFCLLYQVSESFLNHLHSNLLRCFSYLFPIVETVAILNIDLPLDSLHCTANPAKLCGDKQ